MNIQLTKSRWAGLEFGGWTLAAVGSFWRPGTLGGILFLIGITMMIVGMLWVVK